VSLCKCVERAVGQQEHVVVEARLIALGGEHCGDGREARGSLVVPAPRLGHGQPLLP
jgi:hypothetical protein